MPVRYRTVCAKRSLDQTIREFAPVLSHANQPFWRLITQVRSSSHLLSSEFSRHQSMRDIVLGCARMAQRWKRWRKLPETWTAPDTRPFLQVASLVSHLFDDYPVPRFMVPVWCCPHSRSWNIQMYLHLAEGRSIRQFKLPLPFPQRMTRHAANWFLQAPDDISPIMAFRWAQVRALGGDRRMANVLTNSTTLMFPTEHDEFWGSVIQFLVRHQPICATEMDDIVRFIDQQKFHPAELTWGRGGGQDPLQPNFTLKGRSLMSLRRHMTNWRMDFIGKFPVIDHSAKCWTPTNIGKFQFDAGDSTWTIEELLNDKALLIEGRIMQHCVASYIHRCARRNTSIWSMKIQQGERRVRALTIEVLPHTRTICQAKGRKNAAPGEFATKMLRQWASQEGLKLGKAM